MDIPILCCYIEDIAQSHPDLELDLIIVCTVDLMRKYSNCPCDFEVECRDISSDWLGESDKFILRVKWHSETEGRIEAVRRTFESLRLTEFAAIGITCILFPNVVNLSLTFRIICGEFCEFLVTGYWLLVTGRLEPTPTPPRRGLVTDA